MCPNQLNGEPMHPQMILISRIELKHTYRNSKFYFHIYTVSYIKYKIIKILHLIL